MIKQKGFLGIFYLKLICTLVIFIFLPITILGFIFYNHLFSQTNNYFIERYKKQLATISQSNNHLFSNIDSEMISALIDQTIQDYSYNKDGEFNVQGLIKTVNLLNSIKLKYKFIDSIYLYDHIDNRIITDSTGTYTYSHFYDQSLVDYINSNTISQITILESRSNRDIPSSDDSLNLIKSQNVLSMISPKIGSKTIVFNLSTELLSPTLTSGLGLINESYFLLKDSKILLSTAPSASSPLSPNDPLTYHSDHNIYTNSQNYFFFSPISSNGITHAIVVPNNIFSNLINYSQIYISILCCFFIITSITLSYILLSITYAPIKTLISKLINLPIDSMDIQPMTFGFKNELSIISNSFDSLNQKKLQLELELNTSHNFILSTTFQDFIEEKITYSRFLSLLPLDSLNINLNHYKIIFYSSQVLTTNHLASIEDLQSNIIHSVSLFINSLTSGIFKYLEKDTYLLLIGSPTLNDLTSFQEKIEGELTTYFESDCYIGESNVVNSFSELPIAYNQASAAFYHIKFFNKKHDKLSYQILCTHKNQDFSYPTHYEESIINAILNRNKVLVQESVSNLINFISQHKSTNLSKIYFVYNRVLILLSKEFNVQNICDFNIYQHINSLTSEKEIKNYLIELCSIIIDFLSSTCNNENIYYKKTVVFIEQNYMNNISISQIADYLNISAPYLSKVFKDTAEMNVIDYLNLYRIEQAKLLLLNTTFSISCISEKVGYNNIQSFGRLFKKFEGTTPGEYRKVHFNVSNFSNNIS